MDEGFVYVLSQNPPANSGDQARLEEGRRARSLPIAAREAT